VRELTEEVSILGYYPEEKTAPTHWQKKFGSKRGQWDWMKKNMPDAVALCTVVREYFGPLDSVEIWIKKKGNAE
jgi:hypothetical protein